MRLIRVLKEDNGPAVRVRARVIAAACIQMSPATCTAGGGGGGFGEGVEGGEKKLGWSDATTAEAAAVAGRVAAGWLYGGVWLLSCRLHTRPFIANVGVRGRERRETTAKAAGGKTKFGRTTLGCCR